MFNIFVYDFPAQERKESVLDLLYSARAYEALREGIKSKQDEERFLLSFKKAADEYSAARFAVGKCIDIKRQNGSTRFGFFTGSTSEPVYKVWSDLYAGLDYTRDLTFNLDEYEGLDENHSQSYRRFMREQLFRHLNLRPENTFFPSGFDGIALEEGEYDEIIQKKGGIHIQLAGIGLNGHIAFIEPFSDPYKKTGRVKLDYLTRVVNAQKYAGGNVDEIPAFAYSMGLPTLLNLTDSLYMLILGEHKAEIAKQAIEGPVTIAVPGSFTQMHRNGNFVLDGAAASRLEYRNLNRVFADGLSVEHGLLQEHVTYTLDAMEEKLAPQATKKKKAFAASVSARNPDTEEGDIHCAPV